MQIHRLPHRHSFAYSTPSMIRWLAYASALRRSQTPLIDQAARTLFPTATASVSSKRAPARRNWRMFLFIAAAHAVARSRQAHGRSATRPIPSRRSLRRSRSTIAATRFKRPQEKYHPDTATVSPSTISRWLAEHRALTTYRRIRDRGRRLFAPTQVIRSHKLYHRKVYEFAYHRAKRHCSRPRP
jgi:hypothetical protein